MKFLYCIIISCILSMHSVVSYPQENIYKLLLKGGVSDYGNVAGFQVSGNGGPGVWYTGPIAGTGVEIILGKGWFAQGTIEYSHNTYGGEAPESEIIYRGENSITDIMINIKKRWDWFFITGGIGQSIQNVTESGIIWYNEGVPVYRKLYDAESNYILAGLIGYGFEVNFTGNFGVFIEADMRFRKYTSTSIELGFLYQF